MYFEQNKTRIYLSIIDVRTLDVESIAINPRARARPRFLILVDA